MMSKRSIALSALVISVVIVAILNLVPSISYLPPVGWIYFPAIMMAIAFSGGNIHAPSVVALELAIFFFTWLYSVILLLIGSKLWKKYSS